MNGYQGSAYVYDPLALGVLAGGVLLLLWLVWILLDRREFEDPMARRERESREREQHGRLPAEPGAGRDAPPRKPGGPRRGRRAA